MDGCGYLIKREKLRPFPIVRDKGQSFSSKNSLKTKDYFTASDNSLPALKRTTFLAAI
jgi:hypothetical protein